MAGQAKKCNIRSHRSMMNLCERFLAGIEKNPSNEGWYHVISNSEMSNFFEEQGRTRVYAEAYMKYVAGENPRRTQLFGKRAISGWKLVELLPGLDTGPRRAAGLDFVVVNTAAQGHQTRGGSEVQVFVSDHR